MLLECAFCGVSAGADSIEALKAELLATEVARCDENPLVARRHLDGRL